MRTTALEEGKIKTRKNLSNSRLSHEFNTKDKGGHVRKTGTWSCEQRFSLLDHSPFPMLIIVLASLKLNYHLKVMQPNTDSFTQKTATFDQANYKKELVKGRVIHTHTHLSESDQSCSCPFHFLSKKRTGILVTAACNYLQKTLPKEWRQMQEGQR